MRVRKESSSSSSSSTVPKALLLLLLMRKMRSSTACVAALLFLFFLGLCLLNLPEPFSPQPPVSQQQQREVTLLVWTHPFFHVQPLPDCAALFRIRGCTITDDRRAYAHADAVLIHHREVAEGSAQLPPEPRPSAQKWIWLNYESPSHTAGLWSLEGHFNLTLSYRMDSDIFVPYGYLIPRLSGTQTTEFQGRHMHPLHRASRLMRPRLLAWVISNWSESQARVAFYHQLRFYIRVDVYGQAGWPLEGSVPRLLDQYQFYLALENSQHTDYVTEKLWNAVQAGAIPVVLGPSRKNYERFLPPEAFIHVDDFPTVQQLAQYLLLLRRKPLLLKRHLDWREGYTLRRPALWAEHYCMACRATRRTLGRSAVAQHLAQWFYS